MTPAELTTEIDRYRRDGAVSVTLFHVAGTGTASLITEEPADRPELATLLQQLAADDAADAGTVASYCVVFRDGNRRELGRRKWRVPGRGLSELEPTEPPTKEGFVAQVMRHDELHVRLGAEQQVRTVGHLVTEIERQNARHERELQRLEERHEREIKRLEREIEKRDARVHTLEAREADVRGRFDESEDKRVQREIVLREELKSLERKDRLLGQFEPVIPSVLARILPAAPTKNGAGAAGGAVEVAALDAFLQSFTEDQLEALATHLNSGQQVAFVQLMKASWARKERVVDADNARKQAENAVVHGTPTEPSPTEPS